MVQQLTCGLIIFAPELINLVVISLSRGFGVCGFEGDYCKATVLYLLFGPSQTPPKTHMT